MRYVTFPAAFIFASTLAACSFQMRAGTSANSPSSAPPKAAPPATTTAPTASQPPKNRPVKKIGRRPQPKPAGTTQPETTAPPPGIPVVTAATPFGGGTVEPGGFKGTLYWVDAGATKIPDLTAMQPAGFLFTRELNVAPQPFSGFPGIDATRKDNFAIRYEAPLVVTSAADYDFRVVSDDAAILLIDGMAIVENDGARDAPAEKTGPVHLVEGTHLITVDYLQTTGNVALQVFCKKEGEEERVCPTQL